MTIKEEIQKALEELGAPRMTYAPNVELHELRKIVNKVSLRLFRLLGKIDETPNSSRRAVMDWRPWFWLAVLILSEIVKFKAAYTLLQHWHFLK